MFEKFIGKRCEAIVVFAERVMDGGSGPLSVKGILESCDGDYIVIDTTNTKRGKSPEKSIIPIKAILVLNVME